MGKRPEEKKDRNDNLVSRYEALSSENPDGGFMQTLENEFDIRSSTIYEILKKRGVKTLTAKKKEQNG